MSVWHIFTLLSPQVSTTLGTFTLEHQLEYTVDQEPRCISILLAYSPDQMVQYVYRLARYPLYIPRNTHGLNWVANP